MPPRSMRQSVWVLSRPSLTPTALGRQPLSVMVSRETALPPRRSAMRAALLANSRRAGGQARLLDRKAIALLTENPAPPVVASVSRETAAPLPTLVPALYAPQPTSPRSGTYWLWQRGNILPRYRGLATSCIQLPFHVKRRPGTQPSAHRQGRTPDAATAYNAPAYAIELPGPLVSRSPDTSSPLFHMKRTRADRAPAKQRTHLSSMRPGWLSQPVLRPPSRGRAERSRTCIATRSRI